MTTPVEMQDYIHIGLERMADGSGESPEFDIDSFEDLLKVTTEDGSTFHIIIVERWLESNTYLHQMRTKENRG